MTSTCIIFIINESLYEMSVYTQILRRKQEKANIYDGNFVRKYLTIFTKKAPSYIFDMVLSTPFGWDKKMVP